MSGPRRHREALWLALLWGWLLLVALGRPLLPIDETRYASVAWEMWQRGDLLLPVLNGEPYAHKPPLLFWLIHAGWALFGVSETWPRLISPLFAAGTLALTAALARQLWPARPEVARTAPFVLLSCLLYSYFATALMFDAMLTFFVTLGLLGLVRASQGDGGRVAGLGLLALGLAGALFSKGPVALLHLLPAALLAPWWQRGLARPWRRWFAGVGAALGMAAALVLAWALPAAAAGGEAYRAAIFWHQTAGRVSDSFAHAAPPWFHLAWLPLTLAPWLLWPRWWRAAHAAGPQLRDEPGWRLAVAAALLGLLAFSMLSGKRPHYLLPEFPLFALIVARALSPQLALRPPGRWALAVPALSLALLARAAWAASPVLNARLATPAEGLWLLAAGALAAACAAALAGCRPGAAALDVQRVAVASVLAAGGVMFGLDQALRQPYDLHAVAQRLARHQAAGQPVAVAGAHHGQWTFAGRLERPPQTLATAAEVPAWLAAHPQGRVVLAYGLRGVPPAGTKAEFTQPYRGGWLAVLAAP
ncbi:MAG: hypothetical protein RL227_1390 [Pseudomonadota bacterium]